MGRTMKRGFGITCASLLRVCSGSLMGYQVDVSYRLLYRLKNYFGKVPLSTRFAAIAAVAIRVCRDGGAHPLDAVHGRLSKAAEITAEQIPRGLRGPTNCQTAEGEELWRLGTEFGRSANLPHFFFFTHRLESAG